MRPILFFIMFLLLIGVCAPSEAANVGDAVKVAKFVDDLMGQKYWDGDWEIASEHGNPVEDIKYTDNSWAWIDIVGFENESIINGTRYVNGTPRSFAIDKYDSGYHVPEDCKLVSYDMMIKIIDTEWDHKNDTTEAIIHTKFVYKEWICYFIPNFGKFCYWQHYTETITISSIVDSPETFTTRIPDVRVHITSYNRSVNPVTYIYIPIENDTSMEDVMISRVSYNGSNISRYDQVGWVMENDRRTEHVEFVDNGAPPSWNKDENQRVVDHCGRFVTVFDPDFNMSLLNISLHTPYETRYITNHSIEMVTGNAKINIPLLKVIACLIISFLVIIIILKVVKRVL